MRYFALWSLHCFQFSWSFLHSSCYSPFHPFIWRCFSLIVLIWLYCEFLTNYWYWYSTLSSFLSRSGPFADTKHSKVELVCKNDPEAEDDFILISEDNLVRTCRVSKLLLNNISWGSWVIIVLLHFCNMVPLR